MWVNLWNSTPWELLHISHPWHHVSVKSNRKQPGKVKVYILWAALFINPFAVFLEDVAGFVISVGGIRGAWMSVNKPVKQLLSTFVLATILSRRFRCSNTCALCCSTASLRPGTPGSPAAADGPWRWGPPAAGSHPVGGRTARPSAGCLPSPAALRCDAAAAPDNPPAERHHVSQYKSLKMCKNYSHAFMCHVVTVFNNNNRLSKKTHFSHLLFIYKSIWFGQSHQTVKHWMHQDHHRHIVYLKVKKTCL